MKKKLSISLALLTMGMVLASCGNETTLKPSTQTTTVVTSIPTSTIPSVPTSTMPSVPTSTVPSVQTSTIPSVPTSTMPSVPSVTGPYKPTFEGYYAPLNGISLDLNTLETALTNLVSSTHTTKIDYGTAQTKLKSVDSYDGDYVECIYTGQRYNKDATGSGTAVWDREHVWAKSHGFNNDNLTAYSDIHHLRVSGSEINGFRNDSYFANVLSQSSIKTDEFGNAWTSAVFTPREEVRGDIARMMFYMDIRYNDTDLKLTLTDNKTLASQGNAATDKVGYFGLLSELVKWSFEDPVDSRELKRNEDIYNVQGNRNPFIDHPELVYYLYNDEAAANGVTLNNIETKIKPVLKNDAEIAKVNQKILSIGTITLDSQTLIDEAYAAYNSLDQVSKSFVSEYDTLVQKEEELKLLEEQNKVDYTKSATYDFTTAAAKSGTAFVNGIDLTFDSQQLHNTYGIYANQSKAITITAENVYEAIKSITLVGDTNNSAAITPTITITDGTKTITETMSISGNTRNQVKTFDLAGLDFTKPIKITITNSTKSYRLVSITFNV